MVAIGTRTRGWRVKRPPCRTLPDGDRESFLAEPRVQVVASA